LGVSFSSPFCAFAQAALTERETYDSLLASLTALEARGTPSDLVKISLIMRSTNFLTLQARYGSPEKKRFVQK
jgi:hypothetical protein